MDYYGFNPEIPVGSDNLNFKPIFSYHSTIPNDLPLDNVPSYLAPFDEMSKDAIMDESGVLSMSSPELDTYLFPELSSSPDSRLTSDYLTGNSLEVLLCHKPRGCKGIWQPVANKAALRVTKGKGKWLKLEIRTSFPFKRTDTEIFLLDTSSTKSPPLVHSSYEGFSIESQTESQDSGQNVLDVELKLDRVCKRLQFCVIVKTPIGELKGKSVEFGAHNNGKANKKECDDSPIIVDHASDSHSSPIEPRNYSPPERVSPEITKKRKTEWESPPIEHHHYEEEPAPSIIPGPLQVNGVVKAKAFLQFSDLRLKADIQELKDAVNIVTQLHGKTFQWRQGENMDKGEGGKRVIGLIAQEVQKVVPEIVHLDENGYLSVAYAELVPILIQAFREHNQQYQDDREGLKTQIEELSIKLEGMAAQLQKVETDNTVLMSKQRVVLFPQGSMEPMHCEYAGSTKMSTYKRSVLKALIFLPFFGGITALVLGSIFLGINLSSTAYLNAAVIAGKDLGSGSISPDAYCSIKVGSLSYITSTAYNDPNPVWNETMILPIEGEYYNIYYEVYDKNQLADSKLGFVQVVLDNFPPGKVHSEWVELNPYNADENVNVTSSGQIWIIVWITPKPHANYQWVLLALGLALSLASLYLTAVTSNRLGARNSPLFKFSPNNAM